MPIVKTACQSMTPASSVRSPLPRGTLPQRLFVGGCANLDDVAVTIEHARLLRAKPLLRRFYQQSYRFFRDARRMAPPGACLEIGSGGGFLKEFLPRAITSDVLPVPGNDLTADAVALPFADRSLAAIFMLNAFHHVSDAASFLAEACRCLTPGGVLAMVEPANTAFSRFIYQRFHHEPFLPDAAEWRFPSGAPLLAANGALPWIVFQRDREEFARRFPSLEIVRVECGSPLLYLLSGGFTLPSLVPGFCAPAIDFAERLLAPANALLGLFMRVLVVKR